MTCGPCRRWRAARGLLLVLVSPGIAQQSGMDPLSVIELRQYTLHPRQRDVMVELFEREFIERQEAVEMTIIGT